MSILTRGRFLLGVGDRQKLGRNVPRKPRALCGVPACRPRSRPRAVHAGPGSLTYTFSNTFFIRETEATSVLFGSRLSKISIR